MLPAFDISERFNKLLVQSNLQMHQIKEDNKKFKKRIFYCLSHRQLHKKRRALAKIR